jgi:hypothetical protein
MQLTRYRSAAIALVTAACFSLTSTATAVARPLEPVGLPAPTPLVLHTGETSPVAPGFQPGVQAQAALDVPIRVPAQTKVTLGKFILVLLAIVGLIVLAAIAVIVYALWDIRTNNE